MKLANKADENGAAGVYVPEGPERDALTAALAKECYVPVYLDPKIVRTLLYACMCISCS